MSLNGLSTRARRVLTQEGATDVDSIVKLGIKHMLMTYGLGIKTVLEIILWCKEQGVELPLFSEGDHYDLGYSLDYMLRSEIKKLEPKKRKQLAFITKQLWKEE
jgi:hypothetical protein